MSRPLLGLILLNEKVHMGVLSDSIRDFTGFLREILISFETSKKDTSLLPTIQGVYKLLHSDLF